MEENRQNGPTMQKKDSPSQAGAGLGAAQWRNTAIVAGILAVVFVGSYIWFQAGSQQQVPILPVPAEESSENPAVNQAAPDLTLPSENPAEAMPSEAPVEGEVGAVAGENTGAPAVQQGEPARAEAEEAVAAAPEAGETAAAGIADAAFVWPVTGWISQQFGWQYSETFQDWRWHSGVDITTEPGAEVKSAADGQVLSVEANPNWGNMIVVQSDDGWLFRYGNVTGVGVETGQQVNRGDVIARVGPAGSVETSQSDLLHLETVQDGVERDPLAVIRAE